MLKQLQRLILDIFVKTFTLVQRNVLNSSSKNVQVKDNKQNTAQYIIE